MEIIGNLRISVALIAATDFTLRSQGGHPATDGHRLLDMFPLVRTHPTPRHHLIIMTTTDCLLRGVPSRHLAPHSGETMTGLPTGLGTTLGDRATTTTTEDIGVDVMT